MKKAGLSIIVFFLLGTLARSQSMTYVPEESSVTYRLVHPLHKIEATSKEVRYNLDADVPTRVIRRVLAQVDVTTFSSGNSNRDSHAMEVIDALSYPEARFVSTSITPEGDSLSVNGSLTFHGVTKDIVLKVAPQWSEKKVVVRGGFNVSLAAFNIERPSLLLIPVEDSLMFSITAVFEWK